MERRKWGRVTGRGERGIRNGEEGQGIPSGVFSGPESPIFRGSVHSGFQTVVRDWSGEQIPAPHLSLNLASVYIIVTFCPLLNLFFTSI